MEQGQVRLEDRLDTAADLVRRHQTVAVMDVWRALLNARELWYPIVLQLHRFMVAASQVSVIMGGVVRPLIFLFGIRGVASSSAGLTLVLMLILLCFLVLQIS